MPSADLNLRHWMAGNTILTGGQHYLTLEADFHTTSDLIWASDGGLQLCVFACVGTTWSLPSVKCVWADLSFALHCLRLRFTWNCSVYEVKHVLGKYFNLC